MRNFKILNICFIIFYIASCKQKVEVTYEVNSVDIYESKAQKTKPKNEAEYISILYTNIFQDAISPTALYQTQNVMYSIGDQAVAKELLLSNYFNQIGLSIPTDAYIVSNTEKFIIETYKRFMLRSPSQSEIYFFKKYIQENPKVTVEMVYTAFAASDEYGFY